MYNVGLGTFDQSTKTGSVYDNVQTGYWEALKSNIATTWNYNPTSSLLRSVDQAQAYDSSNVYLKRDDLNKEHAELGLVFKKDTRKGVVDYLVERKKLERKRQDVVSRSDTGLFGKGGFFLSSLVTSFADPANIAASFVPVVGQARFANMVARAGLLRARIGKGAIEGFVGNAAIEPLVYGVAKSEQADYGAYDAFINLTAGTLIGSTFHVGFGKLGDYLAKKRGTPNIYQRLAAISPENQQSLLRHSVVKLSQGQKVDTGDLIVKKTKIGDKQLNEIDDQVVEFKKLYQLALKKKDKKSALVYLRNIRNLQKRERDLIAAKTKQNDQAVPKNNPDGTIRDRTGQLTEQNIEHKNKTTVEVENEAELLSQRNQLHQKQLDVKDEDLTPEFKQEQTQLEGINNNIKNKTTIRDAIKAGTNCVKRGS